MNRSYITKAFVGVTIIFLFIICTIPAVAQPPQHFDFGENYYTTFGYPDVSASIVGNNEFSRGDRATVDINLMNKGVITGFRSDIDARSSDLDIKLQQTEMQYEAQRTTAIGIVAILASPHPEIKVRSGPQEAGTLRSGEQTSNPLEFDIEVTKNAASGTYPLVLNILYGYQENVQVSGDDETDLGVTNMEIGIWYEVRSQNVTLPLKVKDEAKFEVTDVRSELYAGDDGLLYVTYKNTGEMPARDSIVRITVADPFSTTDDQAYLGLLEPGQSEVAVFRLDVLDTAIPKMYSITSQIRYQDTDGHDRITDIIRVRTEVLPPEPMRDTYIAIGVAVAIIIAGMIAYLAYRKGSGGSD
ncbi:conserved hypothetical protein [Methanosalsum zhilinae DSM 4017]|uniref:S-layer-like domain-containing protein n=1 Tax=Methanosalsum zhilinae (strain DSM 4017 / NBRC 107636 / OCM 62 / WeN5) TaxID=679901 RepID=F7XQM0_METZD|nr:hypothetical protein [Methanosalsum zhilinae]AEH61619.1 conserved hypothetical protein [Methanosalsum zhilinae DSM 4017]